MNFVSPDTLFSAYPVLTGCSQAIVNPRLFDVGRIMIAILCTLLKYHVWGFHIQTSVES